MQLLSVDTTIFIFLADENMKNPSSKAAHNQAHFFQYTLAKTEIIQPKNEKAKMAMD